MKFSEEIILEAAKTDLIRYCQSNGFELIQKGNAYFLKEVDSCQINGNMWKRWSGKFESAGLYNQGNAIQFVREFENLSFQEAVMKLLAFREIEIIGDFEKKLTENKSKTIVNQQNIDYKKKESEVNIENVMKNVELPEKNTDNKRVIAYLTKTRKIHPEIVNHFIKNGSLYEDSYHNAVFIGYNEKGVAAYAFKRSTNTLIEKHAQFKGEAEGSQKQYNWCSKSVEGGTVKVFESPFDALSAITLDRADGIDWRSINYLSLGCVAPIALEKFLDNNKNIKRIELCLDNDTAGRKAINQIIEKYNGEYECVNLMPDINSGAKDYNQLLVLKSTNPLEDHR